MEKTKMSVQGGKNKLKNLKWLTLSISLGLLLGGGMAMVSAWTSPTDTPPNGNIGAPVNVSGVGQIKSGALQVNGFRNVGNTVLDGTVGIGDATPDGTLKVDINGQIGASEYCDQNGNNCVATSGMSGVPTGAVMFFALGNCPSGWSEYTNARGRYVVGLPSGGDLGARIGNDLNNRENRPTGGHWHYGAQGVRGISGGISNSRISPQGGSGTWQSSVSNSGSDPSINMPAIINTVAGTNAPYVQLLACRKN